MKKIDFKLKMEAATIQKPKRPKSYGNCKIFALFVFVPRAFVFAECGKDGNNDNKYQAGQACMYCFGKYLCLFCLFILLFNSVIVAQNERSVKIASEYGYNYVWENFGGLLAVGTFPLKNYFMLEFGLKFYNTNVYAVSYNFRTVFEKQYGEWYVENRFLYRAFVRNHINELADGILSGFRCDYLCTGAGIFARLISEMGNYTITNQQRYLIEPFNFIYFIEGKIMKNSSLWNVGARVANYDDFQLERPHQPIFTFFGLYVLKNRSLTFFTDVALKPSGVFFLSANFYEIKANSGVKIKF